MYERIMVLESICEERGIAPIQALLRGLVPDEWLLDLILPVWTQTPYPSLYAGTDTYVRLFERAAGGRALEKGGRPTVIYRGTSQATTRDGRGMSWTRKRERARYHAHTSDHQQLSGKVVEPTIWSAEILPDGILAKVDYEVIVNPRRLRKLQIIEQEKPHPQEVPSWFETDELIPDDSESSS